MSWFDSVTNTSPSSRQAWRDNFNGGQPAGVLMSEGKSGVGSASRSAPSDPTNKMHVADILAAMNAGGPIATSQAANAEAPAGGKFAPTPRPASARPAGKPATGGTGDPVDDALAQGFTMDQIIAGAAGAAAGAAAMKLFSSAPGNSQVPASGAIPTHSNPIPPASPRPPTTGGPALPQVQGSGTTVLQKGPQAPTGNQNILTRNGLVSGQPTMNPDINAQFYALFGIPMPGGPGEPRLLPPPPTGNGVNNSISATQPPLANNNQIPGPRQNVKQLGDMDSPTYRQNFGLSDISMRAQHVVDTMNQYGITDPSQIGSFMDVSADPAVARAVRSALQSAF